MIIEKYYKPGLILNHFGDIFVSGNCSFVVPEIRLHYSIFTRKFRKIINTTVVGSYYDRIGE